MNDPQHLHPDTAEIRSSGWNDYDPDPEPEKVEPS